MAKYSTGKIVLWVVIAVLVLSVIWVVGTYNSLVSLQASVDEKWANVETQYQRRMDLIPNLVSTVKGYAAHEEKLFTQITALRSQWQASTSVNEKVGIAQQVDSAISRLLVVVESYPDLKASQNFLSLQDELAGTENRVSVERTRFNAAVKDYNVKTRKFPANIIAGMFGFSEQKSFEAQQGAEKAPEVKF